MISKKQRIPELFFNKYYKKSVSTHTPHFLIKKAIYNGQTGKFAVIIAKKTIKHSVDRNAIKRLIYTALKPQNQKKLYFIILKKDIRNSEPGVWQAELDSNLV